MCIRDSYIQVQTQLAVTGLQHAYLAGDCDASFYLLRVERDEELIGIITEQVAAFWELHVRTGRPPKAEAKDADVIRRVYRSSIQGKTVDLAEMADDVQYLRELRSKRREIEAEEKDIKARLLALMGNAQTGTLPDGSSVRMVDVNKQSFDKKAFEAAHPEMYERFVRMTRYRQLRP